MDFLSWLEGNIWEFEVTSGCILECISRIFIEPTNEYCASLCLDKWGCDP